MPLPLTPTHCAQYYRLALTAIQKQLGPDDPEQVAYVANLAGVLQASGSPCCCPFPSRFCAAATAAVAQRALKSVRSVGAVQAKQVLWPSLARTQEREQHEEAEALLEKALALCRRTLGEQVRRQQTLVQRAA